jgi:hypothetical protein
MCNHLAHIPKWEPTIFTGREGRVHHVSLDNAAIDGDRIADWIAQDLAGTVA